MERARSFGSVAELYDRYRPAPPPALTEVTGDLRGVAVLEIAAGTGLVTRWLIAQGAKVTAVEPDEQMRAVLERRSPGVVAVPAVAEDLPFPDRSFDAVVTSSAWHWFSQPTATNEIARVLVDDGRLFVLSNGFSRDEAWLRELLVLRGDDGRRVGVDRHALIPDGPFVDVEPVLVPWTWRRDHESIVQLFHTYSGVIAATPEQRARIDATLRQRLDEIAPDGEIDLPMAVRGVRARRSAR